MTGNSDDAAKIEALGFVRHPRCPLPIVTPKESANWLDLELANVRRYRRRDKIDYIRSVKEEFNLLKKRMPDLQILNLCLEELIVERFKAKYGRLPGCPLDEFKYAPGASRLNRPWQW